MNVPKHVLKNGTIVLKNGTIVLKNGTIVLKNGTNVLTNVLPNGLKEYLSSTGVC
jgi:nitrogen fixation protein